MQDNTENTIEIDISGLDKAELLAALVNAAKEPETYPQNQFSMRDSEEFTKEEAQERIDKRATKPDGTKNLQFGYIGGKGIFVDISGNTLRNFENKENTSDNTLQSFENKEILEYDKINETRTAKAIIDELRQKEKGQCIHNQEGFGKEYSDKNAIEDLLYIGYGNTCWPWDSQEVSDSDKKGGMAQTSSDEGGISSEIHQATLEGRVPQNSEIFKS